MRYDLAAVLSASLGVLAAPLMAAEVVLTISKARLPDETEAPRSDVVYVMLDPDSTQALAEFSADHIGEMTEFRVANQLVFSARLSEAITTGSLALHVGNKAEQISSAKALFEQLDAGASLKVIAPAPDSP